MSKEELKNLDDQVLEVANRAGEARRTEDAQSVEDAEREQIRKREEEARREKLRIMAEQKRKALLQTLIRVLVCVVGAAAFASLLLVPESVPVIGWVGVIIFTCVCAVVIDRHVRRWG